MRAMTLVAPGRPLELREQADPRADELHIVLRVTACAVCRTDLHIADGELAEPKLPLVLGHQIVGRVEAVGRGVRDFAPGDRVGVPWLGWTDQTCALPRRPREPLPERALHRLPPR